MQAQVTQQTALKPTPGGAHSKSCWGKVCLGDCKGSRFQLLSFFCPGNVVCAASAGQRALGLMMGAGRGGHSMSREIGVRLLLP